MYHFIHSFVEETFIDAIQIEHTERIHNSCKREWSPAPVHILFSLHIVAEVVRATADSKSTKGLQISKPVFQVSQLLTIILGLKRIVVFGIRIFFSDN